MSIFKSFAAICCLVSLFVQGSAYAAAMPQAQMTQTTDCTEMAQHDAEQSDAGNASDTGSPCDNMTLGCLVVMGCISPLVFSEPSAADPASPIQGARFAAALADKLTGKLIRPEFPPPQTILAA